VPLKTRQWLGCVTRVLTTHHTIVAAAAPGRTELQSRHSRSRANVRLSSAIEFHNACSVGAPSSIFFGGEDTEREKSIMHLTLFGQNKHWVSKT
jgi:hypothetical protein